jgi:hypothetical protein
MNRYKTQNKTYGSSSSNNKPSSENTQCQVIKIKTNI